MFHSKKFSFKIISVFKLYFDPSMVHSLPRNFHALSVRLNGSVDFIYGDKMLHTEKNGLVYIPKGCGYTRKSNTQEELIIVHFDILNQNFTDIETLQPNNKEIFLDLFDRIYKSWHNKSIGYEYLTDSLFSQILQNIAIENFTQTHFVKQDFSRLIEFIHANFSNAELSVSKMAEFMGVSGTYLRKLFLKNLNVTPLEYLTKLRIDYASSLLETGYYTIEKVAELSGYNNPKYFSTCYKQHTGQAPIKKKTGMLKTK